jgi:Pyruvate/2-oxoacid:ferredoxin oxidoreductase gamma subunit
VQCDLAATEQAFAQIDRLGYEPRQRETWPADRICAVRPSRRADPTEARAARENTAMRSALRFDRVASRPGVRVRYRVRPLLQRADVIRSRPPKRRWRRKSDRPLATPEVVHRSAPLWRAHLAGYRSGGAGLAATVLCQAGRLMGYAVSAQHDPSPIGAGRRAWTEILFTHPRAAEPAPPLTARTPFGEADLIVGLDAAETLRAITADPELCVASADRTFAVVNDGFFVDERRTEVAGELREQLRTLLRETTRAQPRIVEDFADACRARLHTDRVADLVLLGAAFQVGLVPVHAGAIEAAVAEAEAAGYGRAGEAFRFGRTLADDQRGFRRLRDEREDEGDRMIRRLQHGVGRRRGRRRGEAERLRDLLRRSLEAMPGLSESDPGRQARRDFAASLYRCTVWGGTDYAERYANRIVDLYRADRGDTGRALVRNAILPLAAAMLIRDLVYVASMSVSGEQTREIRQKLNVKRARSDELERRFLTRFELVFYGYRLRADLRTSDWPAQLLAWGRGVVPRAWRGTRRERALRRDLERLIDDARRHASERYEYYHDALVRLNRQAEDHALRGMAVSELRMLVDPGAVETTPST